MWVGVGAGVGVGVGVDFSKLESESESLKFGRLRSPVQNLHSKRTTEFDLTDSSRNKDPCS